MKIPTNESRQVKEKQNEEDSHQYCDNYQRYQKLN